MKMTISDGQAAWQSSPAIPDLSLEADLGEKLQDTPKSLEKGSLCIIPVSVTPLCGEYNNNH